MPDDSTTRELSAAVIEQLKSEAKRALLSGQPAQVDALLLLLIADTLLNHTIVDTLVTHRSVNFAGGQVIQRDFVMD